MNEIRVGGRVKRRNRGKIHDIRHDEGAGALGVKVGDGLEMIGERHVHGVGPHIRAGAAVVCLVPQITIVDPDDKQRIACIRRCLEANDIRHHGGAGIAEVGPVVGGVKSQSLPLGQHLNPNPAVGIALAVKK